MRSRCATVAAVLLLVACSSADRPAANDAGPPSTRRRAARSTSTAPTTAAPTSTAPTSTAPDDPRSCADGVLAGMGLEERVGQLLMVGVDSTAPGLDAYAALVAQHAGSVVLRTGTAAGQAAVRSATDQLQSVGTTGGGVQLFVATDQEGGLVQRLKGPGFADMPTALDQGRLSPGDLTAAAADWGSQLAGAGVNLDLAPVLGAVPADLGTANAPIGRYHRQYGADPDTVAAHGTAFLRGMARAGVAAAAKHFPGLGRASGNTDDSTGVVDTATTRSDPYLEPFAAAVAAGVPVVMVSSATYPQIDPGRRAVFSPVVIEDVLRGDLGFEGVVLSDDLGEATEVAAVPVGQRAVDFVAAGGDLVLTVAADAVAPMAAALVSRAEADAGFRARVDASARRVLAAKADYGLLGCADGTS